MLLKTTNWSLSSSRKLHNDSSGFSIMEAMIGGAIMMVMGLAFTNMISQSAKSTESLEEKISILEFQKTIMGISSTYNVCSKAFTDTPAAFTIPVAAFPPAAGLPLNGIYLDPAGTKSLAVVDQKIDASAKALIDTIKIVNLVGTGPDYVARLEIRTRNTSIHRKPITTNISVSTTTVGTDIVLTGCSIIGGGGGGSTTIIVNGNNVDTQAICDSMGGFWTDPGGGRPAFCSLQGEGMDWF